MCARLTRVAAFAGVFTLALAEVPANRAEACGVKLTVKSASVRKRPVITAAQPRPAVVNAQPRRIPIRSGGDAQPTLPVVVAAQTSPQELPTTTTVETGPQQPAMVAELSEEIFFGRGSSQLDHEGVLVRSATWLAAHPGASIRIEGHADRTGTPARNLKLSQSRAETVKSWFVAHGVDASRIAVHAFGDTNPKYDALDERNRRVSISSQRP
jgi:outer membrane protein OmpA-like peptidoglycan-associated protein